jgi:hypothetical protein
LLIFVVYKNRCPTLFSKIDVAFGEKMRSNWNKQTGLKIKEKRLPLYKKGGSHETIRGYYE